MEFLKGHKPGCRCNSCTARRREAAKEVHYTRMIPTKVTGVPLKSLMLGENFYYQKKIYKLLNVEGGGAVVVDLSSGSDEGISMSAAVNVERVVKKIVPEKDL